MAVTFSTPEQRAQMQMQQAQLQQQYAQQQAMMNNAAAQMSGVTSTMFGGGSASSGMYAAQQAQNYRPTLGSTPKGQSPTFEQLEDPDSPFNLSLEALCNMWGARFGYRWVKDEDTADALEENSDMWSLVAQRLLDAGLLIHQQYRHLDMLGMGVAWKLVEKDHASN